MTTVSFRMLRATVSFTTRRHSAFLMEHFLLEIVIHLFQMFNERVKGAVGYIVSLFPLTSLPHKSVIA